MTLTLKYIEVTYSCCWGTTADIVPRIEKGGVS